MRSPLLIFVVVLLLQAATLVVLDRWLGLLQVTNYQWALVAAGAIALINAFIWPVLLRVLSHARPIVFVLATIVLNGLSVLVAGAIIPAFVVSGLWTAFIVALALTLVATIFTTVIGAQDADFYSRWLIRRVAQRSHGVTKTDVPGVLFLEIDGLSEPVLRQVLQAGRMPTLAGWLESGSHRLVGWECDLSSQTGASQAGILHGNNANMPAFRWVEKDSQRIMVSNHPKDTAELERRISDGQGLLAGGGAGRNNMFSGDADGVMLTFSTLQDRARNRSTEYMAYFANPYAFTRTVLLVIWDIILELSARLQARLGNVQPRGHRGGIYPLVRAFTTVLSRDIAVSTLISDMYRGVPAAYVTLVGYDEVAHHSGVTAPDALAVLNRLDQQFARLELAARDAARPYHFVVLSDHGQSQGATFKQRHGMTLADVVQGLMAPGQTVADLSYDAEQWGALNAFLTETAAGPDSAMSRMTRSVTQQQTRDGAVDLGPGREEMAAAQATGATATLPEVTVLASGNLGLIYFNQLPGRQTDEQILAAYPRLLPGLTQHAHIGFVMVRSAAHGPVAIGRDGINFLAEERVEGVDPLAPYGPRARQHLLRSDSFTNAPDLLVNSFYDPATDEVCAFEELIGCHGGLGGKQMHSFLIYPVAFSAPDEPIVGAEQVYHVLKGWLVQLHGVPRTAEPGEAGGRGPANEFAGPHPPT